MGSVPTGRRGLVMRRVDGACPREPHERSSLSFHWLRNHEERLLHLASRRPLHPFAARVLLLAARVLLYLCRPGRPPLLLRPRTVHTLR